MNTIPVELKTEQPHVYTGVYQHDYGQILQIHGKNLPAVAEVQFSLQDQGGQTETRVGVTTNDVLEVQVPDKMLKNERVTENYCIFAYLYITDGKSGNTECKITIHVTSRPAPGEAGEDPDESHILDEAVNAVNAAAERAEQAEQNAKASAIEAGKYAASASESATAAEKKKKDALREVGEKKQEAIEAIQEQEETSVGKITTHTDDEIQRILNQTAEPKRELEQTITNADTSKGELDHSIETAGTSKTALDKSVELAGTAKTELDTFIREAGEAKTALDGSARTADEMQETLSATVKQAGALDASLGKKIETGTQLKTDLTASGEKAVQDIQTAGSEQLGKMRAVAEEFTADREQIATNKEDIGSLKEDLGNQEVYIDVFEKSMVCNEAVSKEIYSGTANNAPNTINKLYDSKYKCWQQFNGDFYGVVQEVTEGDQYIITGTSLNEHFQLVNFFDTLDTDNVLDFYPKTTESYGNLKVTEKILTVPKNGIYMVINSQASSTVKIEKVTGYKDFKAEMKETVDILKQTSEDVNKKANELNQSCVKNDLKSENIYEGVAEASPNLINKMCYIESNYWQTFEKSYCGISLEVTEGDQYIISGQNVNSNFVLINLFDSLKEDIKGIQYYPTKNMVDPNKDYYNSLNIKNYVVKIPHGCVRMVINSHRKTVVNIRKVTGYKDFKAETEESLSNLNNKDNLKLKICNKDYWIQANIMILHLKSLTKLISHL